MKIKRIWLQKSFKKILGLEGDFEPIRKFRGDSKFSSYLYQIVTYSTLTF